MIGTGHTVLTGGGELGSLILLPALVVAHFFWQYLRRPNILLVLQGDSVETKNGAKLGRVFHERWMEAESTLVAF